MLLEKSKFNENDIVSFKLSSGEELIARYVKEDMTHFVVTKPSMLVMNQQGMGMAPYMFTVNPDKDYNVNKNCVVSYAYTEDDLAKQYMAKTSGIAMV